MKKNKSKRSKSRGGQRARHRLLSIEQDAHALYRTVLALSQQIDVLVGTLMNRSNEKGDEEENNYNGIVDVRQKQCILIVANERCGPWYTMPSSSKLSFPSFQQQLKYLYHYERGQPEQQNYYNNYYSCYFKSTDGHVNTWNVSLKRLNLHLIQLFYQQHQIQERQRQEEKEEQKQEQEREQQRNNVNQNSSDNSSTIEVDNEDSTTTSTILFLIDSSVRKVLPDSFSRTIPIWACVLNRVVEYYRRQQEQQEEGHTRKEQQDEISSSCISSFQEEKANGNGDISKNNITTACKPEDTSAIPTSSSADVSFWDTNLYMPRCIVPQNEQDTIYHSIVEDRVQTLIESQAIVQKEKLVQQMIKPLLPVWIMTKTVKQTKDNQHLDATTATTAASAAAGAGIVTPSQPLPTQRPTLSLEEYGYCCCFGGTPTSTNQKNNNDNDNDNGIDDKEEPIQWLDTNDLHRLAQNYFVLVCWNPSEYIDKKNNSKNQKKNNSRTTTKGRQKKMEEDELQQQQQEQQKKSNGATAITPAPTFGTSTPSFVSQASKSSNDSTQNKTVTTRETTCVSSSSASPSSSTSPISDDLFSSAISPSSSILSSKQRHDKEQQEQKPSFVYTPGAADDAESWARHLTPQLFWSHMHGLLNRGGNENEGIEKDIIKDSLKQADDNTNEIDDIVDDNIDLLIMNQHQRQAGAETVGLQSDDRGGPATTTFVSGSSPNLFGGQRSMATCFANQIGKLPIWIGSRKAGRPPECWNNFDVILNVTQQEYPNMMTTTTTTNATTTATGSTATTTPTSSTVADTTNNRKKYYLQLPVAEGKRDRLGLEQWLPVGLYFLLYHMQQPINDNSDDKDDCDKGSNDEKKRPRRILVHCAQGKDRSVALVMALVILLYRFRPLTYPLCIDRPPRYRWDELRRFLFRRHPTSELHEPKKQQRKEQQQQHHGRQSRRHSNHPEGSNSIDKKHNVADKKENATPTLSQQQRPQKEHGQEKEQSKFSSSSSSRYYNNSGLEKDVVEALLHADTGRDLFLKWIHSHCLDDKQIDDDGSNKAEKQEYEQVSTAAAASTAAELRPLASKHSLRIALHLILQDREVAEPTRSTMQKLNRFFMSSPLYRSMQPISSEVTNTTTIATGSTNASSSTTTAIGAAPMSTTDVTVSTLSRS